jgi:hypothetical protein
MTDESEYTELIAVVREMKTPRGYLRENDFAGKWYCTYCGAKKSKYTSTPLLHAPDCVITRAAALLAVTDE